MKFPTDAYQPAAARPKRPAAQPKPRDPEREAKSAASKAEAAHDADLVRRFNAGEEAVFNEIITRYREKIFSVSLALLRNRADAEEIVQDTFIRAHRGLARFRGDSSLATWLHRIAVNLARNRYWYFYRRKRHSTLSIDCPITEDGTATFADLVTSESPTPATEASWNEFSVLVTQCMEKLDQRHREILTMRNILNRSYQDIAHTLGINEGTVKSRIARARGNLLALMTQECPEFGERAEASDWFERQPAGTVVRGTAIG